MSVTLYIDPRRDNYYSGGLLMGNFTLYRSVAKQAKKDSKTHEEFVKTLRDALARKVFEGIINEDGSLTYGEPLAITAMWDQLDKGGT
jgi:hypothetical protein